MSLEEKIEKRQEIQQEGTTLNQQLRQHQIEQRKEQPRQKVVRLWRICLAVIKSYKISKARGKWIVSVKYAGDDFGRFFYETGKGAR